MKPYNGAPSFGLEAASGLTRHINESENKVLRLGIEPLLRPGTVASRVITGEVTSKDIT